MMILRIRFFEIEKCEQFLKLVHFEKYQPFVSNWHPAGAFLLVRVACLDVFDNMYFLEIDVFGSPRR